MRVYFTDLAKNQLGAIHDYIARDSRRNAQRVVARIGRKAKQVARWPQSGSLVPEYEPLEIREVFEGPYRVIYRVLSERIDVIGIVHGARRLPPLERLK